MIRIVYAVPYEEMADLVLEVFENHNRHYGPILTEDEYSLALVVETNARVIYEQVHDCDIVVARGLTAHNLRGMNMGMPVVEMPVSTYDYMDAIGRVAQMGEGPIAVIGSFNMIYNAVGLGDVMGLDVATYPLEELNDQAVTAVVERVLAEGRQLIVGGVNTCRIAREKGFPAALLGARGDSVWQALSEAKHAAILNREGRKRAEQFKTVFDHSKEGILSIDTQQVVSIINQEACGILGLELAETQGKPVAQVFGDTPLGALLTDSRELANEIVVHGKIVLSVNKVEMTLSGDFIGSVVTFQNVTSIQEAEQQIRGKIYARGHVARYSFGDILGEDNSIRDAVEKARLYARVPSNILIFSETGTGKELFAQSIHRDSDRKKGPFVAVNCAALQETLLESELFGYVEGAFTGASKGGKPGLFELAHGGTIFLDEIAEIPLNLQGRLLRVMQEREIMRLGADRVIPVDVRVVSATNKDLQRQIGEGLFRQDLYYRLNVLSLEIPPLRARGADILLLLEHFLAHYAARFSMPVPEVAPGAVPLLLSCRWDGNVRELRNVAERLVVLNRSNLITEREIRSVLPESRGIAVQPAPAGLQGLEREKIERALQEAHYNKSRAAALLGMNRTTLWRKLKEHNIPG